MGNFIQDLVVRIKGDKSQLDSTLAGAKQSVNSFGSVVKKIGGIISIAFGVHAIIAFSKEAMKAAAEAEGIKNAFAKIGDKNLLRGLREATRGVVGNTDLMRAAIKASNFNIPLKDLAKYLEFATKRAIQTGRAVGDLVDLIVTGLGRGKAASRSFIQLGLAAKDVQSAYKTSGGIFKLVSGEIERMGDVSDTTAEAYGKLAIKIGEFKKAWGDWLNQSKVVGKVTQTGTDIFSMLADKNLSGGQKFLLLNGVRRQRYLDTKAHEEQLAAEQDTDRNANLASIPGGPTSSPTYTKIDLIKQLQDEIRTLKIDLDAYNGADVEYIEDQLKEIDNLEKQIELLKKLAGINEKADIKGIGKLKGTGTIPTSPIDTQTLKSQYGNINDVYAREWDMGNRELDQIEQITQGLYNQQDAVNMLADSFQSLFEGGSKGFENMVSSMIRSLSRLVAEILAKQAVLAILKILSSWNKGWLSTIAGGVSGAAGGAVDTIQNVPSVGGGGIASAGADKIQFELRGTNLVASVDRTRLMLNNNT